MVRASHWLIVLMHMMLIMRVAVGMRIFQMRMRM